MPRPAADAFEQLRAYYERIRQTPQAWFDPKITSVLEPAVRWQQLGTLARPSPIQTR
jgi:hypothetical protein